MSRLLLCSLTLTAVAAAAPAPVEKPAKDKTPAPSAPVEARLVANQNTYALDLGGLSAEEYRNRVRGSATGKAGPAAPKVDLTLELVNTGNKDVEIRFGGTRNVLTLNLKGPGAEMVSFKRMQPRFVIAPKTATLAPGQSVKVPIKSLAYGMRGLTDAAYWTAPGEYTLTASYQTALKPAPTGALPASDGFGIVTLTSAPIKLKVEAK